MFTRISISATIVLTALVWGISLWLFGVDLSWDHAKPFSVTVLLVTAALTAFDKFLWRWAPCRWFHTVPDIVGLWAAELSSSFSQDAVIGTATVTQTFSSISIRLKTDSGSSFLIAERLIRHGDGAYEVVGVYQNDPNIHVRSRQGEIHYGAFKYSVSGNPPTEMSGHYWTDRNTAGSIRLTRTV
jgi:hypothetical protein